MPDHRSFRAGGDDCEVLIVDDDDLMRESLVIALELAGYAVREAAGGRDALRLMSKHHPYVVVTDVLMPEFDGLEILKSLWGGQARPKVIAISGGGIIKGQTCLNLANAFGADAVLAKPFRPAQLIATIEDLMAA